jgi:hypothetical protein
MGAPSQHQLEEQSLLPTETTSTDCLHLCCIDVNNLISHA